MSLIQDRERDIREAYELIREYEDIIRTSSDPMQKRRSTRVIQQQQDLIRGYLAEYVPLCQRMNVPIPSDIIEISVVLGVSTGKDTGAGTAYLVRGLPVGDDEADAAVPTSSTALGHAAATHDSAMALFYLRAQRVQPAFEGAGGKDLQYIR